MHLCINKMYYNSLIEDDTLSLDTKNTNEKENQKIKSNS